MTEADWLACPDPEPMLAFARGEPPPRCVGVWWFGGGLGRKLRLFATACGRRCWPLLRDDRSRAALEVVERFADGNALPGELTRVWIVASQATDEAEVARAQGGGDHTALDWDATAEAAAVVSLATHQSSFEAASWASHFARWCGAPSGGMWRADLLREIFGPLPFRPMSVDPSWLAWDGGAVLALAQAAYDERELPSGRLDPVRLAILADALEDAGCDDADFLSHLRNMGPHVRGCWVVDLLLGKE